MNEKAKKKQKNEKNPKTVGINGAKRGDKNKLGVRFWPIFFWGNFSCWLAHLKKNDNKSLHFRNFFLSQDLLFLFDLF